LSALQNYLREQNRRSKRGKRVPANGGRAVPLHQAELREGAFSSSASPEAAFSSQWTATMIARVLEIVREECEADGLQAHWEVFYGRVARPLLMGEAPATYASLIGRLDLADAAQAANMMVTVKRRFARALYVEVGRTVSDPLQTEDELRLLLRELEHPR
jgi:hypothetical protein